MASSQECPWSRHWEKNRGRYYYSNRETKVTQWAVPTGWEEHFSELPAPVAQAAAEPSAVKGSDTGGAASSEGGGSAAPTGTASAWRKAWSAERRASYYWRKLPNGKNEAVWHKPADFTPSAAKFGEEAASQKAEQDGAIAPSPDAVFTTSPPSSASAASPSPAYGMASPSLPLHMPSPHSGHELLQAEQRGNKAEVRQAMYSPVHESESIHEVVSEPAAAKTAAAIPAAPPEDAEAQRERGDASPDSGFSGAQASPPLDHLHASPLQAEPQEDRSFAAVAIGGSAADAGAQTAQGGATMALRAVTAAAKPTGGMEERPMDADADELSRLVKEAEASARAEDAIVERDALRNVDFLVRNLPKLASSEEETEKPADEPEARVRELYSSSFRGYAVNALQVCDWLTWAKQGGAAAQGDMTRDFIRRMIKQKFDHAKSEKILEKTEAEVAYVDRMLGSAYWRRLFLELYDEDTDSTLTRYTLKLINDHGHHHEIASVVREYEIFDVFNRVLQERLAQVPAADSTTIAKLLPDLKRVCCSGIYTFTYSHELLCCLERRALAVFHQNTNAAQNGISSDSVHAGAGHGGSLAGAGAHAAPNGSIKPGSEGLNGAKRKADELREGDSGELSAADPAERKKLKGGNTRGSVADAGESQAGLTCWRKFRRLRQELVAHLSGYAGPGGAYTRGAEDTSRGLDGPGARSVHLFTEQHKRAVVRAHPQLANLVSDVLENASDTTGRTGRALGVSEAAGLSQCYRLEHLLPSMSVVGEALASGRSADSNEIVVAAVAAAGEAEADAARLGSAVQPRPPVEHLRHPLIVDALMRTVFHHALRSSNAETVYRCCLLLAYASCVDARLRVVAESDAAGSGDTAPSGAIARHADDEVVTEESVDVSEVAQTAVSLLEACEMCVEARLGQQRDLQARLAQAMDSPVVSLCVLAWVRSLLRSDAFAGSANYVTFAPLLLRYCLRAAEAHPLQRPAVFSALKEMLVVNPAEVMARMRLKRQVLAAMLHLVARGYAVHVFEFVTTQCSAGNLDQSLIRHFVGLLLRVAEPRQGANGYSTVFLEAMAALLGQDHCKRALVSLNFAGSDRQKLQLFVRYCLSQERGAMSASSRAVLEELQTSLEAAAT